MYNNTSNIDHKTTIKVDMHCHSNFSDGTMTCEQIAKKLFDSKVKFAALTDHDTLAGLPSFHNSLMKYGIGFISGVEITAIHNDYLIHILAYGFNPDCPGLCAISQNEKNSIYASSYSISKRFHRCSEVIKIIHKAGGVAILAHPIQTEPDFDKLEILIEELKNLGLDGIEAFYSRNSTDIQERLLKAASERELIVSAGTDCHVNDYSELGIDIDLSIWKNFRNAVIKSSLSVLDKKTLSAPKKASKSKNEWLSFALKTLMPAVLSLSLFIIAFFVILLPYFGKTLLERKRESIRELTQVAWGILNEAVEEVGNNQLTLEQAQSLAKNRIEAMRYGSENKDYFWLQDLSPRILMHPYRKDLNGQDVSEFKDAQGTKIFVVFSELVEEKGEGYISYVWQWKDDFGRIEPKESYIRLFEPWGWIIGTGIYMQDVQEEISNLRSHVVKVSLGIIAIVMILLIYLVRQGLLLEQSRSYAERLLNESIERYRALTEVATEGVLFVYESRCRYANTVMYELLVCNSTGLELLDIDDIFPEIDANRQLRDCLSNNRIDDSPAMIKGVLRRFDGSDLDCNFTIRNDNNQNTGYIILVRRATDNIEHSGTHIALNRLLQLPASIVSNLTDSIKKSRQISEVVSLCRQTPNLVHSLLENSTSAITITYMISTITDVAVQRIIDLCIADMGEPPSRFVFLALGSHGRQSQTLYSDQDNALIYELQKDCNAEESENYFLELSKRVCDALEQAGYRKCICEKIASNPKWCKPLTVWKSYFDEWIRNCEPQQVIDFSIFFDFRAIYGDSELVTELNNFISSSLQKTPFFLSQVAQNVLIFKTPIRLFGTIVTSMGKEHSGRVDVKSPTMAIVCFARVYALQKNIHETNTLLRLDAMRQMGILLESKHRNLVTVYETLLRMRLWNQALAIEQNQQLDNWVDLSQMGNMEEVILRECFKEIDELHNFIQRDFFV